MKSPRDVGKFVEDCILMLDIPSGGSTVNTCEEIPNIVSKPEISRLSMLKLKHLLCKLTSSMAKELVYLR